MFGLSRHSVRRFCQHANPAPVNSHRTWSIPVSAQSDFAVLPHEKRVSSLQSSRSIRARQSHLQTVIDGQESRRALDKMSKLHKSQLDTSFCTRRSGSSQRRDLVEDSMSWNDTANQHGAVDQLCERCALRLRNVPRHTARMTSVSAPSSASVQEALKRMSLVRDNDFTAKAVRDMIAEVDGRRPRKKASPQPTIVHNTVYNSGAAFSATISSGTPVHREISTPPTPRVSPINRRWRLSVVSILQTDRIRVRRENVLLMEEDLRRICRDAWHGNFSEVHRWSMRVFQNKFSLC